MNIVIKIGTFILNIIYFFLKLFKTQNKVTFISRQSNHKSEDFALLEKEIKKKDSNIRVVVLCKKIGDGPIAKISYFFHMFVQMWHLATSKVTVLDSYCIVASILKKKKGTVIIQIWHAVGAFKKFGYSVIDMEEGAKRELATAMKMHNNYDYVVTSSNATKKYFAEAFNVSMDKLRVYPLPRIDKLFDDDYKEKIKEKVYEKYPILKSKKTIVYAPTFRKTKENPQYILDLINCVDYKKYNLVIKLHPLTKMKLPDTNAIIDKKFSTIDMMIASDFVITDYSAVVFEAALLSKPLFFYCYDYDDYYKKRNFYIDYKQEMPGEISNDPKTILNLIEKGNYDLDRVDSFSKKYVEADKTNQTKNLTDFIIENLK